MTNILWIVQDWWDEYGGSFTGLQAGMVYFYSGPKMKIVYVLLSNGPNIEFLYILIYNGPKIKAHYW